MGYDTSRRCALWVSPRVFVAAEELADVIGLDVDTFIACAVLELRNKEIANSRSRARAEAVRKCSKSHVMSRPRSEQPATPVGMTIGLAHDGV